MIKNLGIVFSDKLSVLMFTDFLRKTYLEGENIEMVSYTLFNSSDVVAPKIEYAQKIKEKGVFPIFLIKGPENINQENKTLAESIESLDQVVVLKQRDFPNPLVLKGGDELNPLLDRWRSNLERMSNSA